MDGTSSVAKHARNISFKHSRLGTLVNKSAFGLSPDDNRIGGAYSPSIIDASKLEESG